MFQDYSCSGLSGVPGLSMSQDYLEFQGYLAFQIICVPGLSGVSSVVVVNVVKVVVGLSVVVVEVVVGLQPNIVT